MPHDRNGNKVKVGSVVKHKHNPDDSVTRIGTVRRVAEGVASCNADIDVAVEISDGRDEEGSARIVTKHAGLYNTTVTCSDCEIVA